MSELLYLSQSDQRIISNQSPCDWSWQLVGASQELVRLAGLLYLPDVEAFCFSKGFAEKAT